MKNKKRNKNSIYMYIAIIVVIIIMIFVYGMYRLFSTDKVLIDDSKEIVYTLDENKEYEKRIPAINVIDLSDEINQNIIDFIKPYYQQETNKIDYHYQVNGNVLSLLITIEDYSIEGAADVHYLSYIIDLKKLKVLSKEEILNLFDTNEDILVQMIDKQFKSYYELEKKNKNINSNMSYTEFLKCHDITDFKNEMYYDIKDGKLNVYLDYNQWASEEEENYLLNLGYVFEFE